MPAAFYDFFRKIKFLPNNVTIEADSTTDTAQLQAGVNIAFDVEDSTTGPGASTDKVVINGPRYDTYVPVTGVLPGAGAIIRLERDPLGTTGAVQTDITIETDPLSPILVDRINGNTIRIGSSSPTIPFSREQIEDFAAQLLTGGTHTEITVNYDDLGSPVVGNIDLAVTSTLQTVTNRGATTTNAITISDATGSSNTSTGALRVTAGGLAVFENINAGGYVKATTLQSTQATGTAPLTVASTTMVTNLQAETASKWHTARTLTLGGDLSGSVSIDGSSNVTLNATVELDKVALGTDTTGNYVAAGAVSGNGLSGSASSEGATFTVSSNATALNTAETIVFRNSLGDFAAGTITAALSGNATTATTLATSRTINTVSFNGSANIVVEPFVESDESSNATRYITFVDSTTDGHQRLNEDSGLTYNPSTNTVTASVFNGAATLVSLTATNTTNATHFITFVDTATGNENIRTDTDLIYNPSTNVLSAGTFSGIISGSTVSASSTATLGASTIEAVNVVASALTGAITLDVKTNSVYYYTANATTNWTLNFRGDGSTTMNTFLTTGQSATVVLLATQGVTAFYPTAFTIDGTAVGVSVRWLGGAAPTGGNASSVDSYSFTIVKTAASTYTVFASQSRFA